MKKEQDQEHNASTSREERFIRAWGRLEHIEDPRLRLRSALSIYETEIIMDDWRWIDVADDFAIETNPVASFEAALDAFESFTRRSK